MAKTSKKSTRRHAPREAGGNLSIGDRKALVGVAAFLVGVLFLRRLWAAKGELYIDEVSVQKAKWTRADEEALVLSNLQRRAKELLAFDLDEMAPTRRPTPLEEAEIQEAIDRHRIAGRKGEGDFLAEQLRLAKELPLV